MGMLELKDTLQSDIATVDTVVDGIATAVTTVDTVVDGIATAQATPTGIGSVFHVSKQLAKSAIVTGGVDVTGVSSGGAILIREAIIQNDGNNVTTATLIQLKTDNAEGSAFFLSAAIAALEANELVSISQNSGSPVVLESGKKVIALATGSSAGGTGNVTVHLICERLASGASLAAA